jgi:ribosome-associated heat shock protein Hsp15
MANEIRIDKWLWTMRLFKTRSLAAEYCKRGRVMIHSVSVKPSRTVKVGDVIQVRRAPVTFSFQVVALSQNRLNAKLVADYMKNVTSPDQLALLEVARISGFVDRNRGLGRPTKKERRDLDSFTDQSDNDFSWFDEDEEDLSNLT